MLLTLYCIFRRMEKEIGCGHNPWEKNVTMSSPWAHCDHGGHGSGPNDHGSVTARRGHSSVTARSQLSHGEVTAQSRHLQYDHGSVTARSQLNHGPVTAQSRLAVTILVTVSSRWAHGEQSRWPIFFSWEFNICSYFYQWYLYLRCNLARWYRWTFLSYLIVHKKVHTFGNSNSFFSDKTPPQHVATCRPSIFYFGGDSVATCHDSALHARGMGHIIQEVPCPGRVLCNGE